MKKIWKVLAIAAAAASVIPYKVEENLETGEKTWDALLWQVRTCRNAETGKSELAAVSILPTRSIRSGEADWFEDEDEDLDLPDKGSYVVFPDGEVIVESDEPGPF